MLKTFRSYQLAVQFYRQTKALKLHGGLKDQFRRASSSVALNLAEGSGKTSRKDQLRFYEIALGSVRECEAIFDLTDQAGTPAAKALNQLAGSVFSLCRALKNDPASRRRG